MKKTVVLGLVLLLAFGAMSARKYGGGLLLEIKYKEQVRSGEIHGRPSILKNAPSMDTQLVFLHFDTRPDESVLQSLESAGAEVFRNHWAPPVKGHPTGFHTARIPATREALDRIAAIESVRRIGTAEGTRTFHNDIAAAETGVEIIRAAPYGLTGQNVTVGVIDSGFEIDNADFPPVVTAIDYGSYPDSNYTVNNTITGHGTHVAGSIVGQGTNSWGIWRGMAPGADWIAIKVGTDWTYGGTEAAIIHGIRMSRLHYNCDIINLSMGGWDDYHDGSSEDCQAVDEIALDGCIPFIAAGNSQDDDLHYSGTLGGGQESAFIPIDYVEEETARTTYNINLVWYDDPDPSVERPMTLEFYRDDYTPFNSWQVDIDDMTQSARGTQSRYGSVTFVGNDGIHVKVINQSGVSQQYHLYIASGGTFNNPDPYYTLGAPSIADHAFTVGAYVTRDRWHNYSFLLADYGYDFGSLAYFSSMGPRVDGVQTIDFTAPGCYIASIRDNDVWPNPPYGLQGPFVLSNIYATGDSTTGGQPADYILMQGTSMASPVACGAATLLLQYDPTLTPDQVRTVLQNTARTDVWTGTAPNNAWGYGKIDVEAALVSLIGDLTPAPVQNLQIFQMTGQIHLTWDPVTTTADGDPLSVDGYKVYSADTPDPVAWTLVQTVTSTSCTIDDVSPIKFYYVTSFVNR